MPPEMCEYPEKRGIKTKVTGGKKFAVTEIVCAMIRASIVERGVDF